MRLLLIRHAPAGDKAVYARTGKPDRSRPLTKKGRAKMEKAARGLLRAVGSIDLLASSPLRRALETAEIIQKICGAVRISEFEELSPDSPYDRLLARLRAAGRDKTVALVGHDPHLSGAADYFLTGRKGARIELKKGAACLIEFDGEAKPGGGRLLWSLSPALLRRL